MNKLDAMIGRIGSATERGSTMNSVIERTSRHYEVHEVRWAKDYVWCPESITLECRCGERLILTLSDAVCGCGVDHSATVRRKLAVEGLSNEALHPWREEYRRSLEESGNGRSEDYYWEEF